MLKELEAKESSAAPCFEPDLHIEDLRKSLGTVSFSVPWKGQGWWDRGGAPGGVLALLYHLSLSLIVPLPHCHQSNDDYKRMVPSSPQSHFCV